MYAFNKGKAFVEQKAKETKKTFDNGVHELEVESKKLEEKANSIDPTLGAMVGAGGDVLTTAGGVVANTGGAVLNAATTAAADATATANAVGVNMESMAKNPSSKNIIKKGANLATIATTRPAISTAKVVTAFFKSPADEDAPPEEEEAVAAPELDL